MISAEKRKYDRVKKLRARDKPEFLDMIAGNKLVEVDPAAAPTVVRSDHQLNNKDDPKEGQSLGGAASTGGIMSIANPPSPEQTIQVVVETITETRDSNNGPQTFTFTRTTTKTINIATFTPSTAPEITQISSTTTSKAPADTPNAESNSDSSSSGGISMGAKIGIGVAIPLVLILLGVGIFIFFRRKKQQQRLAHEKSDVGEVMIIGGKHHEEDQSTGSPSGYGHAGVVPGGSQGVDGSMYAPTQDSTTIGPSGQIPVVAAPGPRSRTQEEEDDLMNRPVSPVHDDDLLGDAGSSHSVTRSGTALGGSVRDRGSPSLDDDREMQWILEEERKAKERREQQGRLPTHS